MYFFFPVDAIFTKNSFKSFLRCIGSLEIFSRGCHFFLSLIKVRLFFSLLHIKEAITIPSFSPLEECYQNEKPFLLLSNLAG